MIAKITTGVVFILLLFLNPFKIEGSKACTNVPYIDDLCVGFSSSKAISMDDLGD